MPSSGLRPPLNESQLRKFSVGILYLARLVEDLERRMDEVGRYFLFRSVVSNLSPGEEAAVRREIEAIRDVLARSVSRLGLDTEDSAEEVRGTGVLKATMGAIAIEELRSRKLSSYGALDSEASNAVEETCDELESAFHALAKSLSEPPRRDSRPPERSSP